MANGRQAWWKPLCVFKAKSSKVDGKDCWRYVVWSDIPTCKEAGITIEKSTPCRVLYGFPAGVDQDVVDYYAGVLKKVAETPEWAKYLADSSQSAAYMSGNELSSFIKNDETAVTAVLKREGWLAN